MVKKFVWLATVLAVPAVAQAATPRLHTPSLNPQYSSPVARVQTGRIGNFTVQARSLIVGVTSTATIASGGDTRYVAAMPKYNGVVSLIMDYGAGGRFICSGTLLPDRMSVLTAGHCVSSGAGTPQPLTTTAYFYGGDNPDTVTFQSPLATSRTASQIIVNENYTGQVIDQNDIAIVRLSQAAPEWANSYDLYDGDIGGKTFNVAGYGGRSDTGGSVGQNLGVGRLRQGDNDYGFTWGDSDWGGFFTDRDPDTGYAFWDDNSGDFAAAEYSQSWVSDFDNGRAANDAGCVLAADFGLGGSKFCGLGVGGQEVSVAGGDSGGPQFIDGKIASVTSYGASFGSGFGDIDDELNSSFGEYNGFVPIYLHRDFIAAAQAVPEPGTWAMLIAGFGLVGATARRRRDAAVAA